MRVAAAMVAVVRAVAERAVVREAAARAVVREAGAREVEETEAATGAAATAEEAMVAGTGEAATGEVATAAAAVVAVMVVAAMAAVQVAAMDWAVVVMVAAEMVVARADSLAVATAAEVMVAAAAAASVWAAATGKGLGLAPTEAHAFRALIHGCQRRRCSARDAPAAAAVVALAYFAPWPGPPGRALTAARPRRAARALLSDSAKEMPLLDAGASAGLLGFAREPQTTAPWMMASVGAPRLMSASH